MLSARWIQSNGNETVMPVAQAHAWRFTDEQLAAAKKIPDEQKTEQHWQASRGGHSHVSLEREDGVTCTIDTGNVYVMNQQGDTICTYHLAKGMTSWTDLDAGRLTIQEMELMEMGRESEQTVEGSAVNSPVQIKDVEMTQEELGEDEERVTKPARSPAEMAS